MDAARRGSRSVPAGAARMQSNYGKAKMPEIRKIHSPSEYRMNCPHCGGELEVRDEWVDMETTCPLCQNSFVIPRRQKPAPAANRPVPVLKINKPRSSTPPPPPPSAPDVPGYVPPTDLPPLSDLSSSDDEDARKLTWVKPALKILVVVVLVVVGLIVYLKVTALTPKSLKGNQLCVTTQKRINNEGAFGMREIAKKDLFPVIYSKTQFLYVDGNFEDIDFKQIDKEQYSGTIHFTRGKVRKTMTRPVFVDRRSSFTHYHIRFKYAEHPDYLEEDGDLIFKIATAVDGKLKDWSYVSGKATGKGVLECVIAKGDARKTVLLKAEVVECNDNVERVWVEVLRSVK